MKFFKLTNPSIGALFKWIGWGSIGSGSVTEQQALEVTSVFCAVRVIAEGIAQMPIAIKREEIKDGKIYNPVQRDHWAHKLFNKKPNSWQSPFEFVEHATMMAALCGDFIAIKNVKNGVVRELLPVPNGSWDVEQDENYELVYTVTTSDRLTQKYSADAIFHLRGPSLDGFRGARPVQLAQKAIGLSNNMEAHQSQLSRAGGRPSGILSSSEPLKPDQIKSIRETWMAKFGSGGEGGVAVLDGGFDFKTMQMSAVDAQIIETRKYQIEEISRGFRVFPQMLMQTDKASTFASAEQFFRAHVIHTLGPWVARWEGAIARDILDDEDDISADFDERNLLRGDFTDQADYYSKALGSGGSPAWLTPNDVRQETGRDPIEGGDELPSPAQVVAAQNADTQTAKEAVEKSADSLVTFFDGLGAGIERG